MVFSAVRSPNRTEREGEGLSCRGCKMLFARPYSQIWQLQYDGHGQLINLFIDHEVLCNDNQLSTLLIDYSKSTKVIYEILNYPSEISDKSIYQQVNDTSLAPSMPVKCSTSWQNIVDYNKKSIKTKCMSWPNAQFDIILYYTL